MRSSKCEDATSLAAFVPLVGRARSARGLDVLGQRIEFSPLSCGHAIAHWHTGAAVRLRREAIEGAVHGPTTRTNRNPRTTSPEPHAANRVRRTAAPAVAQNRLF